MLNKTYQGNALNVLKTFNDKLFHCCITSPPYYGLRSYLSEPQIWDDDKNCKHEWLDYNSISLTGKKKGGSFIKGKSKDSTIADSQLNSETPITLTDSIENSKRSKTIRQTINKVNTTRAKPDSTTFINPPIAVKDSTDEIKNEIIGDSGKFNNQTLTGDDAECCKETLQLSTPKNPPETSVSNSSELFTNNGCGAESISDKFNEDFIRTNKVDNPTNPNTTIGKHKPQDIKELTGKSRDDNGITIMPTLDKQSDSALFRTDGTELSTQLPSGTIERFSTVSTENISSGSSIGTRQASPIIHATKICIKCNAIKCELGLEPRIELYLDHLVQIFTEVKRVLRDDGTLFVNLGDSNKNKGNLQIPERFAILMTDKLGFIRRRKIVWHKPGIMPSSVKDNFTQDYEDVFFFVKNQDYYFEQQFEPAEYDGRKDTKYKGSKKYSNPDFIPDGNVNTFSKEGNERWTEVNGIKMRNMRSVWKIPSEPLAEEHFATYPQRLVERIIKAGCPEDGIVLDPFIGSGTTGIVARKLNRDYVGIDLKYHDINEDRHAKELGFFR